MKAAQHGIISTPADGDSVLAVGAVNTSGAVGSFSSYGPFKRWTNKTRCGIDWC